MILDKHGKVVVSTHDVATLDEPATETQQETNEITQDESEETNQSVEENFQQVSPDNLPTLEGYLKDNESNQQIPDRKLLSQQEKVIKITSQASNSIDCSRNNYKKRPSDFNEQCASLKASTCNSANEIPSSDLSQQLHCKEESKGDQNQAAKGPPTFKKLHQNVT